MANLTESCNCEACQALAERYKGDPALLAFYRKNLLIQGWAGETDAIEKAYILAHTEWARLGAERLGAPSTTSAVASDALSHDGCTCSACLALAKAYKIGSPNNELNERMHQVVRRNLLVRGWSGGMSRVEREYVKAHPPKWYLANLEKAVKGLAVIQARRLAAEKHQDGELCPQQPYTEGRLVKA